MPYRVILLNDNESVVIHSPINSKIKLVSGVIHQSAESIDSFDFSFNQGNPADAFINELITEIVVQDAKSGVVEFEGRIRNRTGQTQSNGETVKRYSADDALIYLTDSSQYLFNYSGLPSGLFKKLVEHHNAHVEPHKQFAVGRCEIDSYKVYVDDDNQGVNLTLQVGDNATIKQTTRYIWNDSNQLLNIATSVLGVTHTVEQVGTGAFAGKYLLRHPIPAWGISGWVQAEDIVEVYATSTGSTATVNNIANATSVYVPGTKVKVKNTASIYYQSADGTGRTNIPSFVKGWVLTTREYSSQYNRYAIYHNGTHIAWIDASNLEGGASQPPSQPIEFDGKYVTRTRSIEADVNYTHSTLDAIKEHLLHPFGAEIYWEKIEGVRTLHIVNRRVNETDKRIAIGLNMVSMQENFDPTGIITRLVPIGKEKREDVDPALQSVQMLAQTLGTEKIVTSPIIELGGGSDG